MYWNRDIYLFFSFLFFFAFLLLARKKEKKKPGERRKKNIEESNEEQKEGGGGKCVILGGRPKFGLKKVASHLSTKPSFVCKERKRNNLNKEKIIGCIREESENMKSFLKEKEALFPLFSSYYFPDFPSI